MARSWLDEPAPGGYPIGVHGFAKVNLSLRVGRLRPDGYHEIDTVLQTIDLADTLYVRPRARGFRLSVRRRGPARKAGLPVAAGAANLVLRAARTLAHRLDERRGAEFLLVKRIPAGSGLGGASSDAAATLRLLERLWGKRLGIGERIEMASSIGSDCAFFVMGGRARARGRGERLRKLAVPELRPALLAIPRRGIPTANAYRLLDRERAGMGTGSKDLTVPNPPHKIRALRVGGLSPPGKRSEWNDLEEVVARHYPNVPVAKSLLNERGVASPRMTGSGSAVFGLLPRRSRREQVVTRLRPRSFEIVLVRFTRVGSLWCR